ncbi:MAG: EAL domain-containing protein [Desulfobacterales bacterium]
MEEPPVRPVNLLDRIGLLIIGSGAALTYLYIDASLRGIQPSSLLTVAVIVFISGCTQILVHSVNTSNRKLQEANQTLEQKIRERTDALRCSEMKYRTIFENTGAATIIVEEDMRISLANSRFLAMSGYRPRELLQRKTWLEFIDDSSRRRIEELGSGAAPGLAALFGRQFSCRFRGRDENARDVLVTLAPIPESRASVATFADVTELKEAERRISFQAFHDSLTRLPNRALFLEHLAMAIKRGKRKPDYRFAVIYLDIDRFKLVNDSLGHSAGDELLIAFADRIRSGLRETDVLARLGGDEFVVLLEDLDRPEAAQEIAERLQASLREPFVLRGREVFAAASFGMLLETSGYDQPDAIIRDADAAMYHAKERGRGRIQLFDRGLHEKARLQLQQETDLRKAIDRSQFCNVYQPIVRLKTGSIAGFEALVRWRHPDRGTVPPGQFIAIAEETGLILPLTRLIVEQACRDARDWYRRAGAGADLSVSVNISSRHFLQPGLLDEVLERLAEAEIPASLLRLEITESALMEDTEEAVRLAQRLRDHGIRIAIDDFGTGYSSLAYLQRLPIDILKIDRSFISRIHLASGDNRNIVEAIVSLAHKLNLTVVAEGIETPEQHRILLDFGCDFGQGFYYSPPVAAKEALGLVCAPGLIEGELSWPLAASLAGAAAGPAS